MNLVGKVLVAMALVMSCSDAAFACSEKVRLKLEKGLDRAQGSYDSQERRLVKMQQARDNAETAYASLRDRREAQIALKLTDLNTISGLINCGLGIFNGDPLAYAPQCLDRINKLQIAIRKQDADMERLDRQHVLRQQKRQNAINRQQGRVNQALAKQQQAEARLAQCN